MVDLIVLALIGLSVFLVFRSFRKGGGECASCGSSGTCKARAAGSGHCSAAADMLQHANSALKKDIQGR